ncbi:MAG: rhodanese-related sulfurtransferase [uncultured archaeon A07HR60]|jgi:Rhodanese-related sulfurtransferase|nr:MAG: rhodanese-related sulfurtransferase [Halorubrum sp. J07HR59]ESS10593.1 MAG: rhodanese-related sulfurtransferase [uncultured archaeon A07HR60]
MSEHETDALVTADWVEDHLEEFQSDDPEYRLLEVNNPTVTEDSEYTPYEEGHIPGATFFHWEEDLSDPVTRDILDKDAFEELNSEAGITEDSTVVFYGGGRVPNWFALFAYWEYTYYGHGDARVIDGGKPFWTDNDYELTDEVVDFTPQEYSADGPYESIRAYKGEVEDAVEEGVPLVDVRSPAEFTGEIIAPEGLQETAQRGGHIPGAESVPTGTVLSDEDGTFKDPDELRELYADVGLDDEDERVVTYCRVGERSSIEWYVLSELLGFTNVENYDGSWTEWGNGIRTPIETGSSD